MKQILLVSLLCVAGIYGQSWATCNFVGIGNSTITGVATFYQAATGGLVTVNIQAQGVPSPGTHGIHVHQYGDLSDNIAGLSVGSHFSSNASNPHRCPENGPFRHNGDMGNWNIDSNGNISQNKTLDLLQLSGPDSIIGRAVVIHATTDDCANVASSGARLAFCVIGVANNTAQGVPNQASNTNQNTIAYCNVTPTAGSSVGGQVWFTQTGGNTRVIGKFSGIVGKHGFHVHTFGQLSSDGLAAASHWNPDKNVHGIPPSKPRHVGDMGNIYWYEPVGVGWYLYDNDYLTLSGVNSVIGRTVIVHADPDVCVDPTGNAGSRWGQCVIGLANPTNVAPDVPKTVPSTQDNTACFKVTTSTSDTVTTTPSNSSSNGGDARRTTIILVSIFVVLAVCAAIVLAFLWYRRRHAQKHKRIRLDDEDPW